MKCAAAFLGGLWIALTFILAAAGIAAMPYVKPFMRKRIKMLKKTMHGVACKFS